MTTFELEPESSEGKSMRLTGGGAGRWRGGGAGGGRFRRAVNTRVRNLDLIL